ncbi:MAG: MBL fold metallo-hydrolase [Christensenellales bacterium]
MDIIKMVEEHMSQNSYLVIVDNDAILIDAGVGVSQIDEALQMFNPRPILRAVLLTHSHFDHILELDNILNKYKAVAYIFEKGKSMLYKADQNMSILDIPFTIKDKKNIKTFVDGEELEVGGIKVKCYNTPGHSIDSSCFVIEDNMFTGDTVFKIEVGRCDLFSGDEKQQEISLMRIKNTLSNGIEHFYPGHGSNFNKSELDYNLTRILGED